MFPLFFMANQPTPPNVTPPPGNKAVRAYENPLVYLMQVVFCLGGQRFQLTQFQLLKKNNEKTDPPDLLSQSCPSIWPCRNPGFTRVLSAEFTMGFTS